MWVAEDMSSQELEELVAAAAAVGSRKLDGPADEAGVVAGPIAGKYSGADRVEGMGADNIQPSVNQLVDGKRSEKENPKNLSKMFKFKTKYAIRHVIMQPQRFTVTGRSHSRNIFYTGLIVSNKSTQHPARSTTIPRRRNTPAVAHIYPTMGINVWFISNRLFHA